MTIRQAFSISLALIVCAWLSLAAVAATGAQADAKSVTNPVASDAASVAAGKKLYDNNCAECHGEGGKGDGPRAPYSSPTPPSLVDAEWKHGSSDGEIFTVIQNGVTDTDMASFKKDISERQAWDVVNYVKSLASK